MKYCKSRIQVILLKEKIPETTFHLLLKGQKDSICKKGRKQALLKEIDFVTEDRSISTDSTSAAQVSSSDREAEKLFKGFGFLDNSIARDKQGNN